MDVVLIYEYHLCRQRIQIGWEVEMFDRSRKNPQSDQNPVARRENMSVTISGNETLVYDREKYVIHRLSAVQAGVWNLADGSRTLANLTHDLCEESGGGNSIRSLLPVPFLISRQWDCWRRKLTIHPAGRGDGLLVVR